MRARRWWWAVWAACALAALVGLAYISRTVLRLEQSERQARAEAGHQESVRLALWRMDSYLGPLLAREDARPYFEYQAFYPQDRAYTRMLQAIQPGEVRTPSPLLAFRSEILRLHFQMDAAGRWSSPQVPEGNQLDLVQAQTSFALERLDADAALLAELAAQLAPPALKIGFCSAQDAQTAILDVQPAEPAPSYAPEERNWVSGEGQKALNRIELEQRAQTAVRSRTRAAELLNDQSLGPFGYGSAAAIEASPFAPLWLDGDAPRLCFLRRVGDGASELYQGFLVDWPALERALLAQVTDLFPAARLRPDPELAPTGDTARMASVPALLEVELAPLPPAPRSSPARVTLWASWAAALLAILASGITLWASIDFGQRRSRFASAVTHELRTPLTTFRMYSEMLARGMVAEEQRAPYLETLQRESDRLAGLVENVLAYARLEEGRLALRRERVGAAQLVERLRAPLEERAAAAGLRLAVDAGALDGAALNTDVEAVRQILDNLVDNACKYGRAEGLSLELGARTAAGRLELDLRDHGPGVPPTLARAIFRPFDRGDRDPADPHPGVGLGLALARGLARDLGGDLSLEPVAGQGACFRLALPLSS